MQLYRILIIQLKKKKTHFERKENPKMREYCEIVWMNWYHRLCVFQSFRSSPSSKFFFLFFGKLHNICVFRAIQVIWAPLTSQCVPCATIAYIQNLIPVIDNRFFFCCFCFFPKCNPCKKSPSIDTHRFRSHLMYWHRCTKKNK